MIPTLIIFFLSFAVIIAMIFFKALEIKKGKVSPFVAVTKKVDPLVRREYHRARSFISYFNRRSAVALIQWIAYHVLSWARSCYIWMHRKAHAHPPSKKVIDMVRGRGDVDGVGGASFYLKKISEEGGGIVK